MAALSIRGLSKRYADAAEPALASLDLEVADGELVTLVGPSGCGKSTALRLVAGLEQPSGGSISLDGRDLSQVAPQRRDVAMVFQGYALYPHLSVAENMAFPLKMGGVGKAERETRVRRTADMVGLADKLDRLPHALSGGERQRVAMGRAVVREPKLFLFDEPLSNLDAKLRAELRVELVALLARLGTTALYVTHDQAEAMTMADRVAVLSGGELMQVGAPRAIYTDPDNAFVAGFVGTPMMNLVALATKHGTARAKGIMLPLPNHLKSVARVTVGFRPEHARIVDDGPIRAEVVAVEPLGAETFVYLTCAGERLRARIEGFGGPPIGSEVCLAVAPEHLLWFDAEGRRLRAAASHPYRSTR